MPNLLSSIADVARTAEPTLNQMLLMGGGLNQKNLPDRLNAVAAIDANVAKKKRDAILQSRDDEAYKLAHEAALRQEMNQKDERERRVGYLSALKALPVGATMKDKMQVLAKFYPEKAAKMGLTLANTQASLAEAGYRRRMPQLKPAKFDDKLGASIVGEALISNNIRPVTQYGEKNPNYQMFMDLIVPQLKYYPKDKWPAVISYYLNKHNALNGPPVDNKNTKDDSSNLWKTTKQLVSGLTKTSKDYVDEASRRPVTSSGLSGLMVP